MAEIAFKPALSGRVQSPAITIEALAEGHVLQALGRPGSDHAARLRQVAGESDIRAAGPGQWLLVGDRVLAPAEIAALDAQLVPELFLVDQSHGRVRIGLSGPAVESVLAKGTAVDLALMAPGQSAMTMIGHTSAHLTRLSPDRFEVLVMRGFAGDMWHSLVEMAAEFA